MAAAPLDFERQNGESEEAWDAFRIYRDLGRDRSLDAVARELAKPKSKSGSVLVFLNGAKGAKSGPKKGQRRDRNSKLSKWCSRWRWVERAAEWDRTIDRKLREKQLDEIEAMAKRQAQQAQLALQVLLRPAQELALKLQDPNIAFQLASMSLPDLFELAEAAAKRIPSLHAAERIARGVRVTDESKQSQGGTAEWHVEVYQPERTEPLPDFLAEFEDRKGPEWEGDKVERDDDDD